MNDWMLCSILVGFVGGIFVRSFVDFGAGFALFLLLLGAVVFLINKKALLFSLFLFSAALGMLRYDFADRNGARSALDLYIGQSVTIEGLIVDEPDERESVTRIVLKTDDGKTKILVYLPMLIGILFGEMNTIFAKDAESYFKKHKIA